MSPQDLDRLAPLIAFLTVSGIVSIPILAFSIRYAARPVVDALVRLREVQGSSNNTRELLELHERRMTLLESELQHMSNTLDKVAEAQRFHAELAAPRPEAPTLRAASHD